MTRRPEPDCDRWRAEAAALGTRTGRKARAKRAAWHGVTCPRCIGFTIPPWTPRDLHQEPTP